MRVTTDGAAARGRSRSDAHSARSRAARARLAGWARSACHAAGAEPDRAARSGRSATQARGRRPLQARAEAARRLELDHEHHVTNSGFAHRYWSRLAAAAGVGERAQARSVRGCSAATARAALSGFSQPGPRLRSGAGPTLARSGFSTAPRGMAMTMLGLPSQTPSPAARSSPRSGLSCVTPTVGATPSTHDGGTLWMNGRLTGRPFCRRRPGTGAGSAVRWRRIVHRCVTKRHFASRRGSPRCSRAA
jgi:hypothetical protein